MPIQTPDAQAAHVVYDHTALLGYLQQPEFRWNAGETLGTPVIVTYSFPTGGDLPNVSQYHADMAYAYWSFSAQNQQHFRQAVAVYEAVSGVVFVETTGVAMINVFGAHAYSLGGWANYAQVSGGIANEGALVSAVDNMAPGAYGFQVLLHELGHAMGLRHPHGPDDPVLEPALDTQQNTVMTYNRSLPRATELGRFDIDALRHLYGNATQTAGWETYVSGNGVITVVASGRADQVVAPGQDTRIFGNGGADELIGRQGDDLLNGGRGDDSLVGGRGDDTLHGRDGADDLVGQSGNDLVHAGAHNDTVHGNGGLDTLHGGGGDDLIFAGDHRDLVRGEDGDDTVFGGGGSDEIYGGDGADRITGGYGDNTVFGGAGNDRITGGAHHDTLYGGAGDDVISDSNGAGIMGGGTGADTVNGGRGNDTIYGGAGMDRLSGGLFNDLIFGGRDDDVIYGGRGFDALGGGAGNDTLVGGVGQDTLTGGAGADTFRFNLPDDAEQDLITDFQDGIDRLLIAGTGLSFDALVVLSDGNDVIISANETLSIRLQAITPDQIDVGDFIFV